MRNAVKVWTAEGGGNPIEGHYELLPPASETALEKVPSAPRTYTVRPPRPPSRARAALRAILRKLFRKPLLWVGFFLEDYKLTALAVAALYLAMFLVLIGPRYGSPAWRDAFISSLVASGIFLVLGLINGAAQGIWKQGLFGWLREYWGPFLIVQAGFTFIYAGWAGFRPPGSFFYIPYYPTQVALFWCCAPGGAILAVCLGKSIFDDLREMWEGLPKFLASARLVMSVYRYMRYESGSIFERLRVTATVIGELDTRGYSPTVEELLKTPAYAAAGQADDERQEASFMREQEPDVTSMPRSNPYEGREHYEFTPTPKHAALGFTQMLGLHPAVAVLVFSVDTMIFSSDLLSAMTLWPVSLAAGGILGYITFLAQQKWYGDDRENAKIKALILAFLTAIPLPLPAILSVPAGFVGLFRRKSV